MGPPVQYTGALQPKKKSELQDIANALDLNDQGTKDELQARIKKHLDGHQELEDDPVFAGLFGRRKRSVQPQPPTSTTGRVPDPVFIEPKPPSRLARRSGGLEPLHESTPVKDVRDVSAYLKHPISPAESTPNQSPHRVEALTPSSLPPLPPSPVKTLIENIKAADVTAIVQDFKQNDVLQTAGESLIALRKSLSNSRNIWSLTAVLELLVILYTVIPWGTFQLPLSTKGDIVVPLVYPLPGTFQTFAFWSVLLHWFIPTLLIPAAAGNLISFNPVNKQRSGNDPKDAVVFDPLTASIVRLAAQIAYPFPSIDEQSGVSGLDVLGFQLRVLNASVGLAFAFAETISGAPSAFAQSLVRERRLLTPSRAVTPGPSDA